MLSSLAKSLLIVNWLVAIISEMATIRFMADRDFVAGLAEKLRAAREAAGLSQQQAGERSGVHAVSIARFETEVRTPTLKALYKLAAAYGVGVCELLPPGEKKGGKK